MAVRGKFKCQSVKDFGNGQKEVELSPVCQDETPENQRFHKYTPNGHIVMQINNPPAADQFSAGVDYYVDFTVVPQAAKAAV